jgi:predicted nucleic acid-binding protein
MEKPAVFLDTSALFAGIWSETGGSRQIFRLAEAGAVKLKINVNVVREIEDLLSRKAKELLPDFALLINAASAEVLPEADEKIVKKINRFIHYRADALILASAVAADVDWFITYDRSDFLNNKKLKDFIKTQMGTAGDFLNWYREKLEPGY